MPDTANRVRFSNEEEPLGQYRSISWTAVTALVLGCASPALFINPLLAVAPLAAIVMACVAMLQIRANPTQLIGRTAAVAGLALALFFLSWNIGWRTTRSAKLTVQATQFADDWLNLVENGQLYPAHQLMQARARRGPLGEPLKEYYLKEKGLLAEFEEFLKSPAMAAIRAAAPEAKPEYVGVDTIRRSYGVDDVVLQYRLRASKGHGAEKLIWITVRRAPESGKSPQWQINSVGDKPPS